MSTPDAPLSGPHLDGFVNQVTGLGVPGLDKTLGGLPGGPAFAFVPVEFAEAEAFYRGSDLGRTIVEKPVEEMTRAGWDVEVQPDADERDLDPALKADAARAEPRRAAAGWRRIANSRRVDSRTRAIATDRARRWDAVAMGMAPPAAAPPPPPGPLPQIDNSGAELGEAMQTWGDKLRATAAIMQALKYERAYGGGVVFVGVDEGDAPSGRPLTLDDGTRIDARDPRNLTSPLDLDRVRRVTHLQVLRGGIGGEVTMWRPYRFAVSKKYGEPEIFQVRNTTVPIAAVPAPGEYPSPSNAYPPGAGSPSLFWVHESRFLIFDGEPTSIEARQSSQGWGDSIFTRIKAPLSLFEQGWNAVAILMQEASIASIGIEGFTRALAEKGADARANFIAYAQLQSLMRSVARTNFHDATQKFERQNVSFAGLADLLDRQVDRIAAAAGMPVSVLFGNLKGGLGASEDPSARGWYSTIAGKQASRLLPALDYLYRIGWRSKEGPTRGKEPSKWGVYFRPLAELSAMEEADLRLKTVQADQIEINCQVVTPEEVAAARHGSPNDGYGPIALDMEARQSGITQEGAPPRGPAPPADPNAPQPEAAPAGKPPLPTGGTTPETLPIRMMPTDPWTSTPASTPSASGDTPTLPPGMKPTPAPRE